jgi:hypothetical protein
MRQSRVLLAESVASTSIAATPRRFRTAASAVGSGDHRGSEAVSCAHPLVRSGSAPPFGAVVSTATELTIVRPRAGRPATEPWLATNCGSTRAASLRARGGGGESASVRVCERPGGVRSGAGASGAGHVPGSETTMVRCCGRSAQTARSRSAGCRGWCPVSDPRFLGTRRAARGS